MEYLKQNTLSYKTLNFSRRYVSYRGLDLGVCFAAYATANTSSLPFAHHTRENR